MRPYNRRLEQTEAIPTTGRYVVNVTLTLILVYLLALVGVSLYFGRKVKTQEDFAVAGRNLPTMVVFMTMLATWTGTGSLFGHSERTYRDGLATLILPIGELVGISLLALLAGKARGLIAITVQDILEKRYNATARVLGVVALVIAAVTIVSYQYRAAGAIVQLATGFDIDTAILIVVVGVILYTATAGMISVAYIDVVMGITMLVGMLIAVPFFAKAAGGIDGMRTMIPPENFQIFGPIGLKEALALTLPSMLLALGDANMYQRFFSARSAGVAKKATLLLIGGVIYIEVLIVINAWFASGLMRDKVEVHGRVIAYAAQEYLPTILSAIILTAMVAIVFSTAIGYLLVPATSIVRDVYQRFLNPKASNRSLVMVSRITVVVLGLIAYGLSKLSDEFLSVALYAYTVYGAAITPSLVAALVWKRATAPGAVSSILGGTAMTLIWEISGTAERTGIETIFPAIITSVLLLVVVSLSTPRQSEEHLLQIFKKSADA